MGTKLMYVTGDSGETGHGLPPGTLVNVPIPNNSWCGELFCRPVASGGKKGAWVNKKDLTECDRDAEAPARSKRAELLDKAKGLVTGDRNNQYGPPTQDFQRSADALNAFGYRGTDGRELKAHDVAVLASVIKISRLMWSPGKQDHWVDIAGYAACGWECVSEEGASDDS